MWTVSVMWKFCVLCRVLYKCQSYYYWEHILKIFYEIDEHSTILLICVKIDCSAWVSAVPLLSHDLVEAVCPLVGTMVMHVCVHQILHTRLRAGCSAICNSSVTHLCSNLSNNTLNRHSVGILMLHRWALYTVPTITTFRALTFA